MSTADDILFAPIREEQWRVLCKEIIAHVIEQRKFFPGTMALDRPRPIEALFLDQLLEAYHVRNVRMIYYLYFYDDARGTIEEVPFDGTARLPSADPNEPDFASFNSPRSRSILDANLVRNGYNHNYVFETRFDAELGLSFLKLHYPKP